MDLHSGRYFWPRTYLDEPNYKPLIEDISCDVLIIGAGTSGAHCAYYLSQYDIDVVIIDKGKVGRGSTVVNTALLQYIGDKMFHQLSHTFGEGVSARHHWLCRDAIEAIEKIASKLPLDPHFMRRDSLFYSSNANDVSLLRKEYYMLKKHNFPVEWLEPKDIANRYGFEKDAAITTLLDGEVNPFRYTHGLIQAAATRGTQVYEDTEIVGKILTEEEAAFFTSNNKQIKAKHVIFASGYENLEFKLEKNTTVVSSYALFTNRLSEEALSPWYNRSLIWESARPYLYIRTTQDNRVVIGGLDEPTASAEKRDGKIHSKKQRLMKEFNKLFPTIPVIPEFYYGAFYGGTHDGLPMIGMYEEFPNCYFLLCFGDNGIVYSKVLSDIIGDIIVKETSANLPVYLQTRPYKKSSQ